MLSKLQLLLEKLGYIGILELWLLKVTLKTLSLVIPTNDTIAKFRKVATEYKVRKCHTSYLPWFYVNQTDLNYLRLRSTVNLLELLKIISGMFFYHYNNKNKLNIILYIHN